MNYVFFIFVEFESDRRSPRESVNNGRNGANGLNCKIFIISELIFENYDENYPTKKKFQVSPTIFKFSPLNHLNVQWVKTVCTL